MFRPSLRRTAITMSSADFLILSLPSLTGLPLGLQPRPPRVRCYSFAPYICRIYAITYLSSLGLWRVWPPYPILTPLIRFLFVRPVLCLQLPSDSASRQTPLLFGYSFSSTSGCDYLNHQSCTMPGAPKQNRLKINLPE